jgi:glutamate carboxypeptidase
VNGLISACLAAGPDIDGFARELVAEESPSTDPAALERCARLLVDRLQRAGAAVSRIDARPTAAHVVAEWPGGGPRVLLVGHFDTVWPVGQLLRMPLEERDGRLFGPGVLDMKAGLAIGITAARIVAATLPESSRPRVRLIATADEEVGSATSRAAIESMGRESAAVLVLEPALPGGALKTARKGVGEFAIVTEGVSAHAGVDPGAGASAVHELARQIAIVAGMTDLTRGLTINVGIVEGGTRANVVAERARAVVDVRIARLDDAAGVEQALTALRPVDPRVRLTVTGRINRPPMERTAGVAKLYALAQDVAGSMGLVLSEGATGGASDGNFTAALGVPTLDGLGAIGDGPHALHEHVVLKELAPRAALVAGLLARIGDN